MLFEDLGPYPTLCVATGARWVRKFMDEAINLWVAYPITKYDSAEAVAIIKIFMGDHAHCFWMEPPTISCALMGHRYCVPRAYATCSTAS